MSTTPNTKPGSQNTASPQDIQSLYPDRLDSSEDRFNTRNGVFYPNGFALFALQQDQVGQAAAEAAQAGLGRSDLTLLRPEQMGELTRQSEQDAGMLARIVGAELKQIEVLQQLAAQGNHFLLMRVDDEMAKKLEGFGQRVHACKGLRYHTVAVEEIRVPNETIPGNSPFGSNEMVRTMPSDAHHDNDDGAPSGNPPAGSPRQR